MRPDAAESSYGAGLRSSQAAGIGLLLCLDAAVNSQLAALKVLHKRIALCEDPFVEQELHLGGAESHATSAGSGNVRQRRQCIAPCTGTAGRSSKSGVVVSLYAKHGKWGNQVYMWRHCMKLSAQRKRVALTGPFEALNIP